MLSSGTAGKLSPTKISIIQQISQRKFKNLKKKESLWNASLFFLSEDAVDDL